MVHKLTTPLTVFLLTITGASPQANAEDCIDRLDHLAAHSARGTAETYYYGVKDIDITKVTGGRDEGGSELIWYELDDRGRNLCTSTFAGAELFGENRLLTSDDPHFDPNTDDDLVNEPAAVIGLDLHWAAAKAYDYTVRALGIRRSADIVFSALNGLLPSEPTFADLRQATITAAATLYGGCSTEEEEVGKAWYAVGVGPESIPAFEAQFITAGPRGQGPVHLISDQSLVDPGRALRPLKETIEDGVPSERGDRGLKNFAKSTFIILGKEKKGKFLPQTELNYKNFFPAQKLSITFPAFSAGIWAKPAPIKDERTNVTKNTEEREKVDASYIGPGGFAGWFTFWEMGTVNIDVYDLDCAISGSFAMVGDDGTTMEGTFRFRVDRYLNRQTDEWVEPAKE